MEVNGQLYPRGKSLRHPLDRRLGGPQSQSGRCGEEKNLVPARNGTPTVEPVAGRYTDCANDNDKSHAYKALFTYTGCFFIQRLAIKFTDWCKK
jgi:hypothetical protein